VQAIITEENFHFFVHGWLIHGTVYHDSVVDANTLNTFISLDKHWLDQDVLYNFHSELTGTGDASICM